MPDLHQIWKEPKDEDERKQIDRLQAQIEMIKKRMQEKKATSGGINKEDDNDNRQKQNPGD